MVLDGHGWLLIKEGKLRKLQQQKNTQSEGKTNLELAFGNMPTRENTATFVLTTSKSFLLSYQLEQSKRTIRSSEVNLTITPLVRILSTLKGVFVNSEVKNYLSHDFPLLDRLDLWYNDKIEIEGENMNIQQLRYVVAIANSGTFVKRLRRCTLASQSIYFCKRLGKELRFKIFPQNQLRDFPYRRGMEFL